MPINLNTVYAIGTGCLVLGILYFVCAKFRNRQRVRTILGHTFFVTIMTFIVILSIILTVITLTKMEGGMWFIAPLILILFYGGKLYQYGKEDFGLVVDETKFNITKIRGFGVHLALIICLLIFIATNIILMGVIGFSPSQLLFILLPGLVLIKVIQIMMKDGNKPQ